MHGPWRENHMNTAQGLKPYGSIVCASVSSIAQVLSYIFFHGWIFKPYVFSQLLDLILCIMCHLQTSWRCLSLLQLYAYATTADGYAPEYPLPLLFKVEDDNDNAPYFENKVTIFSVPENCRTGKFTSQEKTRFLLWLKSPVML